MSKPWVPRPPHPDEDEAHQRTHHTRRLYCAVQLEPEGVLVTQVPGNQRTSRQQHAPCKPHEEAMQLGVREVPGSSCAAAEEVEPHSGSGAVNQLSQHVQVPIVLPISPPLTAKDVDPGACHVCGCHRSAPESWGLPLGTWQYSHAVPLASFCVQNIQHMRITFLHTDSLLALLLAPVNHRQGDVCSPQQAPGSRHRRKGGVIARAGPVIRLPPAA
mmetsp:Transcript_37108/g.82555  ORF Transcript_37108/g.82555 Transcript_37108/m.82555 type:complete len:216 (-) Transcript_37108:969-1616(-)